MLLDAFLLTLLPLILGAAVCVAFDRMEGTKWAIRGVVGPYFAAVALLFGLFGSLIVGEIWQKNARINLAIASEASALRGLLRIVEAAPEKAGAVTQSVAEYVKDLKQEEASRTRDAKASAAEASLAIIRQLFSFSSNPANFQESAALNTAFVQEVSKLRQARFERAEVGKTHTSNLKILILFTFGFLTQVAIALCHAGQRAASWATVMLFSVAFSVTIATITIIDHPESAHLVSLQVLDDVK